MVYKCDEWGGDNDYSVLELKFFLLTLLESPSLGACFRCVLRANGALTHTPA